MPGVSPPDWVWTNKQTETITFPHPTDAGGKYPLNSRYNYAVNLRKKLAQPVVIVRLLNGTVMQGSKGAVGNITLPAGKVDVLLLSD